MVLEDISAQFTISIKLRGEESGKGGQGPSIACQENLFVSPLLMENNFIGQKLCSTLANIYA